MRHQSLSGSVSEIKPEKWRVWWMLTRPHTLTAAFVPVTLGTVMSLESGKIDIWLFLAMLAASILIQIGTNLFNEYFDFVRGLDNENSVGIGGAIVRYGMKPKTVLYLAYGLFGAARFTRRVHLRFFKLVACADRIGLHGRRLSLYGRAVSDLLYAVW